MNTTKFEDKLKYLSFSQFMEICNIFGVNLIDKAQTAENIDSPDYNTADMAAVASKLRMRHDFDVLTQELIEKYRGFSRPYRRRMDNAMAMIVKSNKKHNVKKVEMN